MNTIKFNEYNEFIIKKSKFITYIYKVDNINEIDLILNKIKDKYSDARHICYAYIIDNYKKYSDDKEPSKTAGFPILNILEKNKLNNVLCITIRYFGGIKLGANGLIRSYSNSAKEVIKKCSIVPLIKYETISITFNYDNIKQIDNILKNEIIISKEFDDLITYKVKVNIDNKDNIINKLNKYIKNND